MDHNHDHESTVITSALQSITKDQLGAHGNHGLKDGMVMSFHGGYSKRSIGTNY